MAVHYVGKLFFSGLDYGGLFSAEMYGRGQWMLVLFCIMN